MEELDKRVKDAEARREQRKLDHQNEMEAKEKEEYERNKGKIDAAEKAWKEFLSKKKLELRKDFRNAKREREALAKAEQDLEDKQKALMNKMGAKMLEYFEQNKQKVPLHKKESKKIKNFLK